ncbi:hypothetical protein GDO81_019106 [Engystomops pustulosus]|uniref:Uncharacterized protein n=1 Tax=Engystomops pustulosus TaxID=76066 RepID=A0AAV6YB60_ENGPU|nr:hypothetical protein GDO81_019106 [Engystomops pustulosus]
MALVPEVALGALSGSTQAITRDDFRYLPAVPDIPGLAVHRAILKRQLYLGLFSALLGSSGAGINENGDREGSINHKLNFCVGTLR